jgi:hypothetical protein
MNHSITPHNIVQRRPDAVSAIVGGSVVILASERDAYCGLDKIGSRIWQHLEHPIAVTALCDSLLEEYEGDPQTIERDVMALLEELMAQGLLLPPSTAPSE